MADYEACPVPEDSCPTAWMTFGGVLVSLCALWREEGLWLLAQFTSAVAKAADDESH